LIITTTDPITGEHLHNLADKPFVIEGEGRLAVKVCFESEENRNLYIHRYHNNKEASAKRDPASTTA